MTNKILATICAISFLTLAICVGTEFSAYAKNKSENTKFVNVNNRYKNLISPIAFPIKNNDSSPQVLAKAVYLLDINTSLPLYAKNATTELPIASTTKIATAMVVLDDYGTSLQDVVTITKSMIDVEPSVINLRLGEKITVENLLNGLLIQSGNDAAYSLAEYFGGKEKFVAQMNEKAKQIGLENTQYKDPAGLDDSGHSTAKDLATIAAYALRNQEFVSIIKKPETSICSTDGRIVHQLKNSNRLIIPNEKYYLPDVIGGKTGFTNDAGHVLVSAANRDGHAILSVILNTDRNNITASAEESKKLIEWAYASWTWN